MELLGGEDCIDSLRLDVKDLQNSILDIQSRCGPINAPSWKYPMKKVDDVNIEELLDQYKHSSDEESNQFAHVVLMELLIDRFVALLQFLRKHTEGLGGGRVVSSSALTDDSTGTSIGLVVKAYWNRMLHTHQAVHHLQAENKANTKKKAELENQVKKLTDEMSYMRKKIEIMEENARSLGGGTNTATIPASTPFPLNDRDAATIRSLSSASAISATSRSNFSISSDMCFKNTQTVESAFDPCERCEYSLRNLLQTGDFVIGVCTAQQIPSSLAKHKALEEAARSNASHAPGAKTSVSDSMSGKDVARWSNEVNKDLSKINKHLEYLLGTIKPLEEEVAALNQQKKDLEKKTAQIKSEIMLERQTSSTERKQFQSKYEKLKQESSCHISAVETQNESLDKAKEELAQQLGTLKGHLEEQKQLLEVLESDKCQLEADLKSNQANHAQVRDLENQVAALTSHIQEYNMQLQSSSQELAREKVRVQSMEKHHESVQGKQGELIERLEQLSSESEELRVKMEDMEEEKYMMEEQLEKAREEERKLQKQLKEERDLVRELAADKQTLQQSIMSLRDDITQLENNLQDAAEREKLLIEYPDGVGNQEFGGPEDVVVNMEKQIRVNSIRIQTLEEQNNKYRRAVSKMIEKQRGKNQLGKPVALWNPADRAGASGPSDNYYHEEDSYTEQSPPQKNPQYSPPSILKHHDRPPSSKQQQAPKHPSWRSPPVNPAGLTSGHIQADFTIGAGAKPRSRPSSAAKSNTQRDVNGKTEPKTKNQRSGSTTSGPSSGIAAYSKLKNSGLMGKDRPLSGKNGAGCEYNCTVCSKGYDNHKDLEIHQMYCYE